jgi:opacity protein-like surface antigen
MRTVFTIVSVLSICLFASSAAWAEDPLLTAKVYRDYPGYINPAVCEKPNSDKVTPSATPSPSSGNADMHNRAATPAAFPYLAAWVGLVDTRDADFDAAGLEAEATFEHGYSGGGAAGYDFGPARLEIEGGYRRNSVDKVEFAGVKVDADGDLKIFTLFANAYADFNFGGTSTPYLGAGIGYADVELEDRDDDVLAGQLAAGVIFPASSNVSVDLGYRFVMYEDPDLDGIDFEVQQHTAMIGLQIRF